MTDPRASLYFALQQCRYSPPKTHDVYYGRIADAVMAVGMDDRTVAARNAPAD